MPTQEEFDAQVQKISDKLTEIPGLIANETQQVKDFIASHPELDTSALEGVTDNLDKIVNSIPSVFPDAPASEPEQ